ncbi:MAG TPA: FAD:protein FMN transferase [Pyrinomonadaceae bacterium]|nr:FAD:protein FMN transferase [Pyrinomonadaceae bacterium]
MDELPISLRRLIEYDGRVKSLWLSLLIIGLSLWTPTSRASTAHRQGKLGRYEDSRLSMGCAYTIVTYGNDAQKLARITSAAFDEVDRIDRLMSHYKPDSPLSRLNRDGAGGPVKVGAELFDFIEEALRYSRESEGAFDITVGPLMKAWGFFRGEGRVPEAAEISELRRRVGYKHLILNGDEKTIRFDRPGVELDLGGIAKGYAVDSVVSLLKRHNITAALISACGSTLYGMGTPPDSAGWEVKIQNPVDPDKVALTVSLKDQSLSVSGSAEKFFEIDGVRYSHIMNPRTGRPVENMLGVAVLAGSGTAGDALDNVFYVQGVERSRKLLKQLPPTEVFFFLPGGRKKWKMVRLKN